MPVGDVERMVDRPPAFGLNRGGGSGVGVEVGADHLGAEGCQSLGGGFADARARPDHQGPFAGQVEQVSVVHVCPRR